MLFPWIARTFRSTTTTNFLALTECLILFFIAYGGWQQLNSLHRQHELERLIAGKDSVQGVNELILEDTGTTFANLLFPGKEKEDAKQNIAAYASLHGMEVLYLMHLEDMEDSEDPKEEEDAFKNFLQVYLANENLSQWWKANKILHPAFGKEFRAVVEEIIEQGNTSTE